MADLTAQLEATQRDLRDTRAALNRAREEIRELRAENEDLRAAASPATVMALTTPARRV